MTTSVWQGEVLRAFVEQVRVAAGLETTAEAEAVSRATLRTLAERVSSGQVDDVMQGLPSELRHELSQRSGQARSFDRAGFVERVSGEITTADADAADHQARAVLRVLQDWSPTGEIDRTVDQLPPALAEMFREGV